MALPTPLETDRDYYVIHESDTQIKLADTLQDALDGVPIDLEDNGDGDVKLIRQNTAEFKLKVEPASWGLYLNQLPMGIDFQNKVQPAALYTDSDNKDYGEGGVSWQDDYSFLVLGFVHLNPGEGGGSSVISVQRSRVNRYLNICLWNFWTIENSIALCEFGDETTDFRAMINGPSDKIWIATNEGIYEYDPASPATPPSLLTIAGLIDTDIKDMVSLDHSTFFGDERDTFVWTGHSTGITRINPTDGNSCKKYITGEGEELEDLTAGYENIKTGTMSISVTATAVRILICGCLAQGSTGSPWVLEDGSGYIVITTLDNFALSGSLRKYTNHISVVAGYSVILYLYDITVTGKNTGDISKVIESFVIGSDYNNRTCNTQMVQLNDNTFVFGTMYGYPNYYTYLIFYEIGVGTQGARNYYTTLPGDDASGWRYAFPRYHLKAFQDSKGDVINVPLQFDMRIMVPGAVGFALGVLGYNEDTGSWCLEYSGLPSATRTTRRLESSNSLITGLTAEANNAVGKDWDTQFVEDDHFTFMHGFTKFKDNLQTMLLRFRSYGVNAREITDSITIPNNDPSYYQVPESVVGDYPNFREVDNYDLVTIVEWNGTRFTKFTLPAEAVFTASAATDELTVGVNIATNTPIYIHVNDWRAERLPYPLRYGGVYFAINVDATKIKLSLTPGGAAIDLVDAGIGTLYFQQVVPTVGTYYLGMNGVFIFAQDDIAKNIDLRYVVTDYN
jgi:hypothetical protein